MEVTKYDVKFTALVAIGAAAIALSLCYEDTIERGIDYLINWGIESPAHQRTN